MTGNVVGGALDVGIEIATSSDGASVVDNTVTDITGAGGGIVLAMLTGSRRTRRLERHPQHRRRHPAHLDQLTTPGC